MTEATQLSVEERLAKVKAKKRQAPADDLNPEGKAETVGDEARTAVRDEEVRATIRQNPIYALMHHASLEKEERIQKLADFFDYDPKEVDARVRAAQDYLYFIQMVRQQLATDHIQAIANKVHSEYQQTLDTIYEDLGGFKEVVAPLREVFELIQKYNKEEQEGSARPLSDRILEAMNQQKDLKRQQERKDRDIANLEDGASSLERTKLIYLKDEQDELAGKWFKGKAKAAVAQEIEAVKAEITAKRQKAAELRQEPLLVADDKDYDPNLIRILDVSGAEFNEQAKKAAEHGLATIKLSQVKLNEAIKGLGDVQDGVAKLFGQANDINLFVSTLEIATQKALKKIMAQDEVKEEKAEGEAPKGDVEKLEDIEQQVEVLRKQRYLSDVQSFERSLSKTGTDVKKGVTSISILDENLRLSIEHAEDIRANAVATVAEAVSTYLQAIVFESNASKIDMISGALSALQEAAEGAQKGQISMLASWFGKDNAAATKRIEDITAMSNLLEETRGVLVEEKATAIELGNILNDAINGLQEANREVRAVIVEPVFPDDARKATGSTKGPERPAVDKAKDTPFPFPGFDGKGK